MSNKVSPTDEQIAAVVRFAHANGRSWRTVLWAAWMNGYGRSCILQAGDEALLQQVRNQFGPSWLDKFSPPRAARHALAQSFATRKGITL